MNKPLRSYFGTALGFFFIAVIFTGHTIYKTALFTSVFFNGLAGVDYAMIIAITAFVLPIAWSFQTPALMTSGRKKTGRQPFEAEEILGSGLVLCAITSVLIMLYLIMAPILIEKGFRWELIWPVLHQGLPSLPIIFLSFFTGYLATRGRIETALGGLLIWASVKAFLIWHFCRFALIDLSLQQGLLIDGAAVASVAIYYILLLKYELRTGKLKVKLSALWFLWLGAGLVISQSIFVIPNMISMEMASRLFDSYTLAAINIISSAKQTVLIPLSALSAAAILFITRIAIGDKPVRRILSGAVLAMLISAIVGASLLILTPRIWIPFFSQDPAIYELIIKYRLLLFTPLLFETVPALAMAYMLGRRQYKPFFLLLLFRLITTLGGILSIFIFPMPSFSIWALLGINAGFVNLLASSVIFLIMWDKEKKGEMSYVDPSIA